MSISLTQKAADFLKKAVADNDEIEKAIIRVGVDPASDFAYTLDLTDEVSDSDRKLTSHDVTILVGPRDWLYVQGTRIDFAEDAGGFTFDPPSVR